MEQPFVPLLLGGDINVYSMARAFHEAYGIKTIAYGMYPSGPCYGSDIIDYRISPNNDDPQVVLQNVTAVGAEFPHKKIILLGCGDNYLTAIAENIPNFPANIIAPYVALDQMERLIHKGDFYTLCDQYQIPYPKTFIYKKGMGHEITLPFSAPYVVKPAESATYWDNPFASQKKAYILQTMEEVLSVVDEIYAHGYGDDLIIQDFIPGDDSFMRVLTSYSDQEGKVRLMCMGHVLLEEHTPHGIGNHAVIITQEEPELCQKLQHFLEDIQFRGFSNMDIKYDQRDGTYKVFELNCRQGRSNYYVTGAGYNLAKYLVEDLIEGKEHSLTVANKRHLWRVIPQSVAYDYIPKEYHGEMKELIAQGAVVNPLYYQADKNIVHRLRILANQLRHKKRYATAMKKG